MSKAILEFNLPDDAEDFHYAVNGEEYYKALTDIRENVRKIWKYGELPEEQFNLVDEIYQMINQKINEVSTTND
jgi:adenylosuccinate synthase